MIIVAGVGKLFKKRYECFSKNMFGEYLDIRGLYKTLLDEKIIKYNIKHFGRFDAISKRACCVTALALYDAGILYDKEDKLDFGIIGTNTEAALDSNINYFKDYINSGRNIARGNLFLYTLPSSYLAEASIHFGLTGPMLYTSIPSDNLTGLIMESKNMILNNNSSVIVSIFDSEDETACYIIADEEKAKLEKLYDIEEILKDNKSMLSPISSGKNRYKG